MSQVLCVTIRFLDPFPTFHGQRDGGNPEWPPSPLRLFQSLVDASASRWRGQLFENHIQPLLMTFENLNQPEIIAPVHIVGTPFRIAVPNNDLDVWARPVSKGRDPKKQPSELKTMKQVHPVYLSNAVLYYLYSLPDDMGLHLETLKTAARSITHLGWGVDMVAADADIISREEVAKLPGHRWKPVERGGVPLRVPIQGTLADLIRKHNDFLSRLSKDGFKPVPPLCEFNMVNYNSDANPLPRPYAVFKLLDEDGDTAFYPHSKLIHVAGMMRHLAIERMKQNPPRKLRSYSQQQWLDQYVAGHKPEAGHGSHLTHAQFSFVPLPSIGHAHTDPAVRRVMIVAPVGDDEWLEHLAKQFDGIKLEPLPNTKRALPPGTWLERVTDGRKDGVRDAYTLASQVWSSFTPVILPGHDDHKPERTRKLIERALTQSGVEQPCDFEWSAFSRFRKSFSAHKCDKKKQPQGYFRPGHLLNQTAIHLTLRFHDGSEHKNPISVPGPLVIGAGRHCGFGLMAAVRGT